MNKQIHSKKEVKKVVNDYKKKIKEEEKEKEARQIRSVINYIEHLKSINKEKQKKIEILKEDIKERVEFIIKIEKAIEYGEIDKAEEVIKERNNKEYNSTITENFSTWIPSASSILNISDYSPFFGLGA